MPNIKSQKDRVVQAKKEAMHNKAVKSNLKTVIKKANAAPGLLGFGVSTCEHVRHALQCGASGVIVGSAIVRIINEYLDEPETMKAQITDYVRTMKAATRAAS